MSKKVQNIGQNHKLHHESHENYLVELTAE